MNIKRIAAFLTALVLCFALAGMAYATQAASVVYEGGAEKFVFAPGSEYSDSDLFLSCKGLMPGDSREWPVEVKNAVKGGEPVRIYMRAERPERQTAAEAELLQHFTLTVKNGEQTIFSGHADELDGLEQAVLLGEFAEGEGTTLNVQLAMDIEAGNEYQFREGEVDWVFSVEEVPQPTPTPSPKPVPPAKTGDTSHLLLWFSLSLVSAIGVVAVFKKKIA